MLHEAVQRFTFKEFRKQVQWILSAADLPYDEALLILSTPRFTAKLTAEDESDKSLESHPPVGV